MTLRPVMRLTSRIAMLKWIEPGKSVSYARTFVSDLTRHYGKRPILYTTVDFYEENQLWQISGVEFWLRSVKEHPSDRYPGQHWTFWQYSGTGLVPGINGRVDLNTFAGSRAQWQDWLARATG